MMWSRHLISNTTYVTGWSMLFPSGKIRNHKTQLVASQATNHYLIQCSLIVNWIPKKKFQWNGNQNTINFIQSISCFLVVCQCWQPGHKPAMVSTYFVQNILPSTQEHPPLSWYPPNLLHIHGVTDQLHVTQPGVWPTFFLNILSHRRDARCVLHKSVDCTHSRSLTPGCHNHRRHQGRPWYRMRVINTLRQRQNGRNFPDNIFKCIFLNENV